MVSPNGYHRRDALKVITAAGCALRCSFSDARAQVPSKAYVFNESFPPRLTDNYDILSISPEQLRIEIGKYNMGPTQIDVPIGVVNGHMKVRREVHSVSINRYKYWSIKEGPFHPAADYGQKLEITSGYEVTKVQGFEKTITLEVGASMGDTSSFLKLTQTMRNSLKMTDSITQIWKEEIKKTIEQKLKENHTYVTWCLYDEMYAVHDATGQILDTPGMNVMQNIPPLHLDSTISCVINTFQDSIADK